MASDSKQQDREMVEQSLRDEPLQVLTSKSTQAGTSVRFHIDRKATILSDNKPHKVTIDSIQIPANYTFSVVPRLTPYAYLRASITNKESFPFLAGEMAVFMGGNFVAKSEIPLISPNESLGIFLGADSAVKVSYKPAFKTKDTFTLLSKTKKQEMKYVTVITNNKPQPIEVTLFEQLPRSNNQHLKVKLITPDLDVSNLPTVEDIDSEAPLLVTPANNIRWKYTIEPDKSVTTNFQYTVEYPIDKEFYETD